MQKIKAGIQCLGSDEELITKHQGALQSGEAPRTHTRHVEGVLTGSRAAARLTLKNVSRGISSIHFYCLFCPEVGSDMQEGICAKLWLPRAHTDKIRAVADERRAQIKAKYRPESVQEQIYKNVCHSALSCAPLADVGWVHLYITL